MSCHIFKHITLSAHYFCIIELQFLSDLMTQNRRKTRLGFYIGEPFSSQYFLKLDCCLKLDFCEINRLFMQYLLFFIFEAFFMCYRHCGCSNGIFLANKFGGAHESVKLQFEFWFLFEIKFLQSAYVSLLIQICRRLVRVQAEQKAQSFHERILISF